MTALFPEDLAGHADTVGRIVSGLTAEIVDDEDLPVGPGIPGNLRCRGSSVVEALVGGDPEMRGSEGIRDGWYYPGDVAQIDADGYVRLLGRSSDVTMRAGVRIFPSVIETALMSHPGVQEVAVVILPHGSTVQVVAAVMPRGDGDAEALYRHCVDTIGAQQSPDSIMIMASLPRTGGGKIDRAKVRQHAARALARTLR